MITTMREINRPIPLNNEIETSESLSDFSDEADAVTGVEMRAALGM
jgi:hypothetical protein